MNKCILKKKYLSSLIKNIFSYLSLILVLPFYKSNKLLKGMHNGDFNKIKASMQNNTP